MSLLESKEEILRPLHLEAGIALYDCQALENSLSTLLYNVSHCGNDEKLKKEAHAIVSLESKKTSGQICQLLSKCKNLHFSARSKDIIKESIDARNLIIHKFFIQNIERVLLKMESNK